MRLDTYKQLYQDNAELVLCFLTRLTGDDNLAEEMTQETFEYALRNLKDFRGDCCASTWLCTIARDLWYAHCNKRVSLPDENPSVKASDIAELLLEKDRRSFAYPLLQSLPNPFHEVFILRTFGDLSHREIGRLFGKSESWSRVTYYRARQILHRIAEQEEDFYEER